LLNLPFSEKDKIQWALILAERPNTAIIFEEWFATSPIHFSFMAQWEQHMHHVHSARVGPT
jgi:hypothetical protein